MSSSGNPFARYGKWETFDDTDGLGHMAYCMLQQSGGYFWMGTTYGISRYDGRRLVSYSAEDGIAGPALSMCEGLHGDLWFGTQNALVRYDGGRFTEYAASHGLPDAHVVSLLAEPDGSIICGTATKAVFRFDGSRFSAYLQDKLPDSPHISAIFRDRDGMVWFGTEYGPARYDGSRVSLFKVGDRRGSGLPHMISQDAEGRIWSGSYGFGFAVIGPDGLEMLTAEKYGLPDNRACCAMPYRGGVFCSTHTGMSWFDGRKFVRVGTRAGPEGKNVNVVALDRDDGLWVAGAHAGVSRWSQSPVAVLSESEALEVMIQDSRGRLWWGTANSLCCRDTDGAETHVDTSCKEVSALLEDSKGSLWTGMLSGAVSVRPLADKGSEMSQAGSAGNGPRALTPSSIWQIYEDRSGTVWIGAATGVYRYQEGKIVEVLRRKLVSVIYQDRAGIVWFAGWEGGGIVGWDGSQWIDLPMQDKLPSSAVTCMTEDAKGGRWIGTFAGLCLLEDGRSTVYNTKNGLTSNVVQRIMFDRNGTLWVATLGGGIDIFDGRTFQSITETDGLPGNTVTGMIEQADGTIIVSGYWGICRYTPGCYRPLVRITSVDADREYQDPQEVTVSAGVPAIRISFSGISFDTKRLRYSHILEGHDSEWSSGGAEEVRYSGLKEGDYVFKVEAVSRDLVRSGKPAELKIRVVTDPKDSRLDQLNRQVQEQSARLKAEHEIVDQVMRVMTDAILLVSDTGRIKESNTGARFMLGYTENELAGLEFDAILPVADRGRFTDLLSTGLVRDTDRKFVKKDGTEIAVMFSCVVAHDGTARTVICTAREASPGGHGDGSLLKTGVFSSTLARLEQAEAEMIKNERLRALGAMSSGVAHDFNNMLVPILGNAELILMNPALLDDKKTALEMLNEIHSAAKDASQVVLNLRSFYASTSAEQYDRIELNKLVEEAVALTRPRWKEEMAAAGISISVESSFSGSPAINGNAAQLRIALVNLIFNSVEAMPQGGRITVSTGEGQRFNTIDVTDTGAGMTEEVRRRCFEPFFTTRGKHGSGLGLSTVYGIIRRHGGQIEVESSPGHGTRMKIRLPAAPPAKKVHAAETAGAAPKALRVLVIDDEEPCRKVLASYLRMDGHSFKLASGGKEALEKFSQDKFDVVLTDRSMPDMSGDDVALSIKKIAPHVPVIMVTGFGNVLVDEKNYPEGVDLVLGKPLMFDDLHRVLADLGHVTARTAATGQS